MYIFHLTVFTTVINCPKLKIALILDVSRPKTKPSEDSDFFQRIIFRNINFRNADFWKKILWENILRGIFQKKNYGTTIFGRSFYPKILTS